MQEGKPGGWPLTRRLSPSWQGHRYRTGTPAYTRRRCPCGAADGRRIHVLLVLSTARREEAPRPRRRGKGVGARESRRPVW